MENKKIQKVKRIEIKLGPGTFNSLFRHLGVGGKQEQDIRFNDISALRQLLSNEKARILHTLDQKKPQSVYELAKLLNRDFKSVRKDLEVLKQFGFVKLSSELKGKKRMLKPILIITKLELSISL